MKVLITGGAGFIGRHLADTLNLRGHETVAYDTRTGQNVLDRDAITAAVADCDRVAHLAGCLGTMETFDHIEQTIDVNIKGALNVFDAALAHGKPVVSLATKVCDWYNPYLVTKRCSAEFALMYHQYKGLRISVVRGTNAYGPGQHWGAVEKSVPTFIVHALRDEPLTIYGDGTQAVDLVHVNDLCDVIARLLEGENWGLSVEAGTGIAVPVIDMAEMILRLTGSHSEIRFAPMRLGEPGHSAIVADNASLLPLMGSDWSWTPLEQGMADTVAWYQEHYLEVEDRG
jgi:UDP-glucose 4-epimerase